MSKSPVLRVEREVRPVLKRPDVDLERQICRGIRQVDVDLGKNLDEALEVLTVARVCDVEVEGRIGGALREPGKSPDHHEIHARSDQRTQQCGNVERISGDGAVGHAARLATPRLRRTRSASASPRRTRSV